MTSPTIFIALLELLAVALILWQQFRFFRQTQAQLDSLRALFPPASALGLNRTTDPDTGQQVDLLQAPPATSDTFQRIVNDTNAYLLKNKGTADFNILTSITERAVAALDADLQSGISTPLYIGLMGTFGGAILGLLSLGLVGGGQFDEGAIQAFLRGVTIAMLGSLCGLGLTLRSNAAYKDVRRQAEQRRNDYYTFLQVQLLPILHSDMAGSLGNLKSVLDAFNQEFLSKIFEFGPIVQALNENISTQKDFLQELQKVGYTQMADASIRVFDKVAQSAHHFENFLTYQQELNEMLRNGQAVGTTLTDLLGRLRGLEAGLNQVPALVQQHEGVVQEQLRFFQQHQQAMGQAASQTERFFDEQYHQLAATMRARMGAFQQEAAAAENIWQEHFRVLNQDNIYARIVQYMSPFSELPAQQKALNALQERQAAQTAQALQAMQARLAADTALQQQLLTQVTRTNNVLERMEQRNWFQRLVGTK
ncbi:hypothetical protein GO988_06210 [Hymenobacter sp. HMF4947]|uniref:MotA/TolQ/ExbB proton channel domain-containing protein n=1 Tax=Hymenobacter ginkgonis TaxID=2682976 RepID=A0A7K1TBX8_9BACT|nr:hypothetical protein [Hymenobacter ginkgonis]MVN75916.1 hypothetical protein [Hymenobacter ginkgonis]